MGYLLSLFGVDADTKRIGLTLVASRSTKERPVPRPASWNNRGLADQHICLRPPVCTPIRHSPLPKDPHCLATPKICQRRASIAMSALSANTPRGPKADRPSTFRPTLDTGAATGTATDDPAFISRQAYTCRNLFDPATGKTIPVWTAVPEVTTDVSFARSAAAMEDRDDEIDPSRSTLRGPTETRGGTAILAWATEVSQQPDLRATTSVDPKTELSAAWGKRLGREFRSHLQTGQSPSRK